MRAHLLEQLKAIARRSRDPADRTALDWAARELEKLPHMRREPSARKQANINRAVRKDS